MSYTPNYLKLYKNGELNKRIQALYALFESCELCPHDCRVNRLEDERGICQAGKMIEISSFAPHYGEEKPLSGYGGSGTIFFSHCNLRCVFCQNCDISFEGIGKEISLDEFSNCMLSLQGMGCHNINLVTPTQYATQIIAALPDAIEKGLHIPLVWNCGGYESLETIKLLDGIIDIYLPDVKYGDTDIAGKYSHAPEYPYLIREVLKEMHRQVGDLKIDEEGLASKGLLIRHLVLPNNLAGSKKVIDFIAQNISLNTYINIMDQYHPTYSTEQYTELNRTITLEEYEEVVQLAHQAGLKRGFEQK